MSSTTPINKAWYLKHEIQGFPQESDFEIKQVDLPTATNLEPNQYLVRVEYFAADPYQRNLFRNPQLFGNVAVAYGIGHVIASQNTTFPVGTIVSGCFPAQSYFVTSTSFDIINNEFNIPLSAFIGIAGLPGATSYGMLKSYVKPGDVVFCNSSAGPVGMLAGWLAKRKGAALVIGTAGTDDKCALAVSKFGYDICINYHQFDQYSTQVEKEKAFQNEIHTILKKHEFTGIDVFFDLVGGLYTNASYDVCNRHADIVIVGIIDEYNDTTPRTIENKFLTVLYKSLHIHGFVVANYLADPTFLPAFQHDIASEIAAGKLEIVQVDYQGIEHLTEAFLNLFSSKNVGKAIIKV